MCFKKIIAWFNKPDPIPEPIPDPIPDPIPEPCARKRYALLFGINNYPGSANDLQGCIHDIEDVLKKFGKGKKIVKESLID
jgi:hypothetical protein